LHYPFSCNPSLTQRHIQLRKYISLAGILAWRPIFVNNTQLYSAISLHPNDSASFLFSLCALLFVISFERFDSCYLVGDSLCGCGCGVSRMASILQDHHKPIGSLHSLQLRTPSPYIYPAIIPPNAKRNHKFTPNNATTKIYMHGK
jgi:hypothetical protein